MSNNTIKTFSSITGIGTTSIKIGLDHISRRSTKPTYMSIAYNDILKNIPVDPNVFPIELVDTTYSGAVSIKSDATTLMITDTDNTAMINLDNIERDSVDETILYMIGRLNTKNTDNE